jgi:hypothetical protein
MTPPDEPEYEYDDKTCCVPLVSTAPFDACGDAAVIQDLFELDLCIEHFEHAAKEEADNQNKPDHEEYGQYETDRSTG